MVTKDGQLPSGKAQFEHDPENGVWRYDLQKFRRCNSGTCFNQKPIVKKGQKVKVGDCLADGPATDQGELALKSDILTKTSQLVNDSNLLTATKNANGYYDLSVSKAYMAEIDTNGK